MQNNLLHHTTSQSEDRIDSYMLHVDNQNHFVAFIRAASLSFIFVCVHRLSVASATQPTRGSSVTRTMMNAWVLLAIQGSSAQTMSHRRLVLHAGCVPRVRPQRQIAANVSVSMCGG